MSGHFDSEADQQIGNDPVDLPGEGVAYTVERFPDRAAWLAARMRSIGGSEAPGVWAAEIARTTQGREKPFDSPMAIYQSKRGNLPDEDNRQARRGARAEAFIREEYTDETARAVHYPGAHVMLRSIAWPWMTCSLDGVILDDGPAVLECKRRGFARGDAWADGIPVTVQFQIQHALAVTGWTWGSAAAWLGFDRFVWGDVPRDDRVIAIHVDKCRALWDCIQAGDVPEADESEATADALRRMYPRDTGDEVTLSGDCQRWADAWEEADADEKIAKTVGRYMENKIRRAMKGAAFGILPDGSRLSLKTQRNNIRVLRRARKDTEK